MPETRRSKPATLTTDLGLPMQNVFTPEHIRQMDVALENLCAATAGPQATPQLRKDLASQIISFAMEGERNSVELYIRCLQQRGLWAASWAQNL